MALFYVYDNSNHNRALIHRHDCFHCNDGKGKRGASVGPRDQFIPADSLNEAKTRAKALGRGRADLCKICKPKDHP
jgi:hypothetical protein